METLSILVLMVLGGAALVQHTNLRQLKARLDALETAHKRSVRDARQHPVQSNEPAQSIAPAQPERVAAATAPIPRRDPQNTEQLAAATATAPPAALEPEHAPSPARAPRGIERPNLESLIGARLPVWIGAVALIISGFFLVRYAVDIGLLTPGVRTLLAALFALTLIGASEGARRIPAVAEDPRVGQALAGAGIASAYGTLYIAAALYALITPLVAFILMVGVTALALFLALRHGPPTAILALAGGFLAPLVAGYNAAGIAPLLTYLALLIAALFGLAAHRRWGWLALATTVLGFGWLNFLLFVLNPSALAGPAAFTVLLAVGATLGLPRTGVRDRWLALAPLVAGLIQLMLFLPGLEFTLLSWGFYLILAAATLVLAWRDARYLPGALAAVAFALCLLGVGLIAPDRSATMVAAALFSVLFAVPGLLLRDQSRAWAVVALGGIAGPILLSYFLAPSSLQNWQWSLLTLIAAAIAAGLSWLRRSAVGQRDPALLGGALVCAVLAVVSASIWLPPIWLVAAIALASLAVAVWGRRIGDTHLMTLPVLGVGAGLIAAALPISSYLWLALQSVLGNPLPYRNLPPLGDSLRALLPLCALVAVLARDPQQFGRARTWALGVAGAIALLLVYHLAKLPLAINSAAAFTSLGFIERAVLTQLILCGAVLLRSRQRRIALALFALGLSRVIWFDLLVFNPLFVPQAVGSIPLANALVVHLALVGLAVWYMLPPPHQVRGAMAMALLTTLAAVRQAAQGSRIAGDIGTGETYLYSAALLLLALGGLALGIRWGARAAGRDLRLGGLGLLTAVTLKVFLVDAAALDGLLRILSFMGLGIALIGISWVYRRFLTGQPGVNQPAPA